MAPKVHRKTIVLTLQVLKLHFVKKSIRLIILSAVRYCGGSRLTAITMATSCDNKQVTSSGSDEELDNTQNQNIMFGLDDLDQEL